MKQSFKHLVLPVAMAITSASAMADVTCGTYSSQPAEGGAQSKVGEAAVVLFSNNTQVMAKSGRFEALAGSCGGTLTAMPDGAMHVVGNCTVADPAGDIAFYYFIQKRGEKRGKFVRSGGTGKFAKEFQEGWYQQTAQNDNGASGIWGGKTAAVCK